MREAKLSERDAAVAELKSSLKERQAAVAASVRELAERAQQADRAAAAAEAAQTAAATAREELQRERSEVAAAQREAQQRLVALEQREVQAAQVTLFVFVCGAGSLPDNICAESLHWPTLRLSSSHKILFHPPHQSRSTLWHLMLKQPR